MCLAINESPTIYPDLAVMSVCLEYICFALLQIRRVIRPFFLNSTLLKFIYDVITFIGTRLCNVYMVVPFVIYELKPTLEFYK